MIFIDTRGEKVGRRLMQQRVSGVRGNPSLAWLLHPLPVETFLGQVWGVADYHGKRDRADYFDGLLPGPCTLDKLLELFRLEPSAVRLVRGTQKYGPDTYRLADGSLDTARVHSDFADGFTVVLDNVERYVRTLAALSHSIEVELNYPTKVNAYITPPGSQGFVPHYDEHDVLILQIEGSKVWHLYDGADVSPAAMQRRKMVADAALPSPTDLPLAAGDVLYLPRGRVHAAEATSRTSVHLTVGIHAPTVLAFVMRALHSLSFQDDRVHTQLPPRHLDDAGARADVPVLVHEVVRALEEHSVIADGLSALQEDLVKRGRCPPVGQGVANASGIDGQTRLVRYQPLYSRVTTVAGGVALQFAKLVVNAAPDHEAALLFVSQHSEPFRVCDLPGLLLPQQTALARTLLISGFLARIDDD
jgi:ribosomal protein L16 Arg81 hydroxylase